METNRYFDVADKIVREKYTDCDGALMAGSIVRGEGTSTSDIDLIIYDDKLSNGYRESFIYEGIPIEVFAHNKKSFIFFFNSDCKRKMPTLPLMVMESVVIKECDYFSELKKIATDLYEKGPEKLTTNEIEMMKYFITDLRDDLLGSEDEFETILIVNDLLIRLHEFYLLTNNSWIGRSKWIKRALKKYDEVFELKFEKVILDFYKDRDKSKLIALIDEILEPYGGCNFDGFSVGK